MVSYLIYNRASIFCLLVIVLFSFHKGVSSAGEKDTPPGKEFSGVGFKDGLLKVSVRDQSLKKVMEEIAEKAEIKILIKYPGDEELTISFDYLPLEKGLKRLLKDKNYAFKYQTGEGNDSTNSTSLMKVFVLSKSEEETVAKSEGLDKNGYPDNARQVMAMNELQNQIRAKLDEVLVLQNLPQDRVGQREQINKVMEKIRETGILKEKTEFEGGADIEKQIKEALQVIQGKGNKF